MHVCMRALNLNAHVDINTNRWSRRVRVLTNETVQAIGRHCKCVIRIAGLLTRILKWKKTDLHSLQSS